MINKLKYSQLAAALGVKQATINVAVSRGHLTKSADKMIDITEPLNKLWIDKQKDQGKIFDLNRIYDKPPLRAEHRSEHAPRYEATPEEKEAANELKDIQLQLKKAQLERAQKASKLDDIKIAKQLGQLIPFDAVKGFFLYTVESFFKKYDQEATSVADVMLSRFSAESAERIETKKELSQKLAEIREEAIEDLELGLDSIVEEFQEVRSRGESKI